MLYSQLDWQDHRSAVLFVLIQSADRCSINADVYCMLSARSRPAGSTLCARFLGRQRSFESVLSNRANELLTVLKRLQPISNTQEGKGGGE